ncbi:MAG: pectinesterase family protein, partial [Candidatus Phytoplasma australasiaticum]|nr:pectinesterase family protein [Candidatus Phytoplasma australasiaticum]
FLGRAILAAEEAVKKYVNFSDSLTDAVKNNSRSKMALDDCKEMMNFSIESLQASYAEVDSSQLLSIGARVPDLRTWLSAAISYQQSCLDGFEHDAEMKETMTKNITEATELTSNALAIVTKFTHILSRFGLHGPPSRRLLSVTKEKTGYPSWFSNADRKLLSMIDNNNIKPDVVVALDGTGQFKTIAEALAAAPKKSKDRHVIYVKAGVYDEQIVVDKQTINILMYGDGPRKTIVTGNKNFVDGTQTFRTSTFCKFSKSLEKFIPENFVKIYNNFMHFNCAAVIGDGFIVRSMGFQNTAGPEKHQAVALRVQSDRSAFFNCRMDAYQDTLYNQANRQFFRNCVISGTIDFIFGDSPTVIQNSLLIVRRPMNHQLNTVTAQGKIDPNENTGIVIQNCKIVPEQSLFVDRFKIPTYLGRPWKKCSNKI